MIDPYFRFAFTHFMPMFPFLYLMKTSKKKKPFGFLTFPGGTEMELCREIG